MKGKSLIQSVREEQEELHRMFAAALDSPGATITRGSKSIRFSKTRLSPEWAKLLNENNPPKENEDGQ